MKTIYLISTGGTIGSQQQGTSFAVAEQSPIINYLNRLENELGCRIEISQPINKNSENFDAQDWLILFTEIERIQTLAQDPELASHGIVVTHGTDTMSYSLAAMHLLAKGWTMPVCFTGSFYAPDQKQSDALINLQASLFFLLENKVPAEVYLAFRNQPIAQSADQYSRVAIYPACQVKQMAADQTVFTALYDQIYCQLEKNNQGWHCQQESLAPNIFLKQWQLPVDAKQALLQLTGGNNENINQSVLTAGKNIALVPLYPNQDYSALDVLCQDKTLIIFQLYHSGTAASLNLDLIELIKKHKTHCRFLAVGFASQYIHTPYLSSHQMQQAGLEIIQDTHIELVYCYALFNTVLKEQVSLPSGVILETGKA